MIGNRTPPFTAMTAAVTPVSPAPVAAAEAEGSGDRPIADVCRGCMTAGVDDGPKEVRLHL